LLAGIPFAPRGGRAKCRRRRRTAAANDDKLLTSRYISIGSSEGSVRLFTSVRSPLRAVAVHRFLAGRIDASPSGRFDAASPPSKVFFPPPPSPAPRQAPNAGQEPAEGPRGIRFFSWPEDFRRDGARGISNPDPEAARAYVRESRRKQERASTASFEQLVSSLSLGPFPAFLLAAYEVYAPVSAARARAAAVIVVVVVVVVASRRQLPGAGSVPVMRRNYNLK